MRPVRVISLARQADRRAEFEKLNAHVAFEFYDAIDGSTLTTEQVTATGLFAPEVLADYGGPDALRLFAQLMRESGRQGPVPAGRA